METAVYLYGFAKRRPPLSSSGTSPLKFSEAGMTVLTLFAFRFGRMVRRGFVGLRGAGLERAGLGRNARGRGARRAGARGGGAVARKAGA